MGVSHGHVKVAIAVDILQTRGREGEMVNMQAYLGAGVLYPSRVWTCKTLREVLLPEVSLVPMLQLRYFQCQPPPVIQRQHVYESQGADTSHHTLALDKQHKLTVGKVPSKLGEYPANSVCTEEVCSHTRSSHPSPKRAKTQVVS